MKKRPPDINVIGEFNNPEMEKTYFISYVESSRKMISMIFLFTAVGHVLMLLLNCYAMGCTPAFALNVLMRCFIVVPCVVAFFYSRKATNIKLMYAVSMVFMVYACVHYQIISIVNQATRFDQQAMSFLLIATVVFMVPVRWVACLITSIATTVCFFICHAIFFPPDPLYAYIQYSVYFFLCIFSSAYFSFNLSWHRRIQFSRETRLRLLSNTDTLTQAYNRQFFDEVLSRQVWKAEGEGDFSIIMFDLDDFKSLNDTYGHAAGDDVLVEVAKLASSHLRGEDVFSRWGGEEFMILLPGADKTMAAGVAHRLCVSIEQHFKDKYAITASFGVVEYQTGYAAQDMVSIADKNMYEAKKLGKNQVCI